MAETYELEVRGEPGPVIRAAFPEFQLEAAHGMTLMQAEFVDRAALHGAIERINSLGLELVGLHVVEDTDPEPQSPDQPMREL
jgi:hypothetical protein